MDITGNLGVTSSNQSHDNDNGKDAGAAYIFERSGGTWQQVEKLIPSNADSDDSRFGSAVDIADSSCGESGRISDLRVERPVG